MNTKLSNLTLEQTEELLPENLILLGYRGSISHNMYVPKNDPNSIDDKDIMGVYIGPIAHYLGFGRNDVKEEFIGEWDSVCYELKKFIQLLLKCNPNVLGLLWLPKRHIIYSNFFGRILMQNRHLFVSKQAYHSFSGYAYNQFKRMTHMNQSAIDEMAALEKIMVDVGVDVNNIKLTQTERDEQIGFRNTLGTIADRYQGLRKQFYSGGYMGEKRRELVRKFGYDTKNAAHLIRLLRMGIEFLIEGELHVEREDAAQLLEIKRGEWSLAKVVAESERLFKLAEEAYVRSSLPAQPDEVAAENLCIDIINEYFSPESY